MKEAGRRLLAAALLGSALACSLPAQARELLAVGAQFERVFEYQDSGDYGGLGVELLRLMAARTGNTVRFRMVPWARAQAMLVQGQADILIGPYKSPGAHRQHGVFRETVLPGPDRLLHAPGCQLRLGWRLQRAEEPPGGAAQWLGVWRGLGSACGPACRSAWPTPWKTA
jgi:hypothetical protein